MYPLVVQRWLITVPRGKYSKVHHRHIFLYYHYLFYHMNLINRIPNIHFPLFAIAVVFPCLFGGLVRGYMYWHGTSVLDK